MAIAITLNEYLTNNHINYDLISHRHTDSSLDSSRSAHIPSRQLAKAVVLQNEDGDYLMASLSAGNRLSLGRVAELTGKDYRLVSQRKLLELFPDCDKGAVPGIGKAYHMDMLVDDELLDMDPVYIESGDHQHLLKLDHRQYSAILSAMRHGQISGSAIGYPKLAEQADTEWQ